MKKNRNFFAALLVLVMLLSILPASALAAPAGKENKESKAESVEKPETVTVSAEEIYYAEAGQKVFNNGGTVYNNDATVYNNGGIVYNNLGTAYNNGGIIYANGGTVYNNAGTVYDNGADILEHLAEIKGDAVDESLMEAPKTEIKEGVCKLDFKDDYSQYIEFDGQDEADVFYVEKGGSFEFTLKEGYKLDRYELSSGEFKDNKDGSFTVKNLSGDAELKLEFTLAEPVFSLSDGTYFESQELSITAPEGADIYYTTDGSEPDESSHKYTKPLIIKDGAVIKAAAISEELGSSKVSELKIAICEIDVPNFKKVSEDYEDVSPKAIEFENPGDVDAVIKKLSISGDDSHAFKLNTASGKTIKAGTDDSEHWTLRPASGLKSGEYSATLIVESGSGEKAEFEITFTVK